MTLNTARMLRNGGIDAFAALNAVVTDVLAELPSEDHKEFKLSIGRVMVEVMEQTINKALAAYPELKPDDETWIEVVRAQARKRLGE